MRFIYTQYALRKRFPYKRYLKDYRLKWQEVAKDRFVNREYVSGYQPWGKREGYPFWWYPIPGYRRRFDGRYQLPSTGRGFYKGKFRALKSN